MDARPRERRWQLALLPALCCLCGLPAEHDRDLCSACAASLSRPGNPCRLCGEPLPGDASHWPCGNCQRNPPPWQGLQARSSWCPSAATLVHQLKFGRRTECARVMAELMADDPPPFLEPGSVFVPVPLHWRRRWLRGFDQGVLLATQLARSTGHAVLSTGLRRRRATAAQSATAAPQRRRALRGAFTARRGDLPQSLVLVDDVATTGATLTAAVSACRAGGAEAVHVWVFARTHSTTDRTRSPRKTAPGP